MYRHDNDALTVMDWFCGAGGSSQGAHAVPGLRVTRAANHWERAIESHAANFPETDHYRGDIRAGRFRSHLLAPACPCHRKRSRLMNTPALDTDRSTAMDHLDPVTRGKILAATVAAHWGDEVGQNPDAYNPLAEDTADVAWLAYQALTALTDLAPELAENIARQFDMGVDVSELAHNALDRTAPDPRWVHQQLHSGMRVAEAA